MMRSSSQSIFTSVPDHLPNNTPIARFEIDGDELAGFVTGARTNGDDLAFLRLFLCGVGDNDAALRLLFAFKAAKDDAVMQRSEFHGVPSRDGV